MIAVFSVIVVPGARHLALSKNTTHPDSETPAACKVAGKRRRGTKRRDGQTTMCAGQTGQGGDKAEGARRFDGVRGLADGGRCPTARGRDASVAEGPAGTVPKRRVDRGQARAAAASPPSTPFPALDACPLISLSPPAQPLPPRASQVCPTLPVSAHSSFLT